MYNYKLKKFTGTLVNGKLPYSPCEFCQNKHKNYVNNGCLMLNSGKEKCYENLGSYFICSGININVKIL